MVMVMVMVIMVMVMVMMVMMVTCNGDDLRIEGLGVACRSSNTLDRWRGRRMTESAFKLA